MDHGRHSSRDRHARRGRLEDRCWVDGELTFDYDEYLSFDEDHAGEAIEQFRWHYYYGGSWGSPKVKSLYLRPAAFWADENCPELEGV